MKIIECGLVEYRQAYDMQERLAADVAAGNEEEILLLLEHPPVYTIGRGGDYSNILDPDINVERINRGGDVTWHGPGQLVGYPLINLARRGRDLHRWLRFLEDVMMLTMAGFGVEGRRYRGSTGVWGEHGKIAFIGVGVRRWVSMHGFALNVRPDLSAYERINPCGLPGCPISTMELECGLPVSFIDVRSRLKNNFEQLLNELLPEDGSG